MAITTPPTTASTTTSTPTDRPAPVAIHHRIGITAPVADVVAALGTIEGLARWWTTATAGDAGPRGSITFDFGTPDDRTISADRTIAMAVEEVGPSRVVWRCIGGPGEWLGSTVAYALDHDADSGETVLLFTHDGWAEVVPFMHHCSTKWATYLLSLRDAVERGEGHPFPDDVRISAWD